MASSSSSSTLNDLPDDVLQHILSYLDMKYVVQTSILAKRWRYFWASLPSLNLDEHVFHSINTGYTFADTVTRILLLRDRSIMIAFRLCVNSYWRKVDIDAWLQSVLKCNVQQLSIKLYCSDHRCFDMPFIFKSKFLTKIHLGSVARDKYTHGSLKVRLPNSIDLPVLTNLQLETICDLSTKDLDKLFAGCPVLETLEIINCALDFSKRLTISALQLKHLVIQFSGAPYMVSRVVITVSCPNLILFGCRDHMTHIYHLESLSKLEIADMNMKWLYNVNDLEWLYNVKSLTLSPTSLLRFLSESPRELERSNIQFGNLRYLKVSTPIAKTYLSAMIYLLKNSPKIETLVIQILEGKVYVANNFEKWGEKLSLKHLKSIKVRGVKGSAIEIEFLKDMLKKAAILEKMTVFPSKKISANSQGTLKFIADELLACPRASSNVEIIFPKF